MQAASDSTHCPATGPQGSRHTNRLPGSVFRHLALRTKPGSLCLVEWARRGQGVGIVRCQTREWQQRGGWRVPADCISSGQKGEMRGERGNSGTAPATGLSVELADAPVFYPPESLAGDVGEMVEVVAHYDHGTVVAPLGEEAVEVGAGGRIEVRLGFIQ